MGKKIEKTAAEWRENLTDEQYRVCIEKGTEAPFSGEYDRCFEPGVYHCVCCGHELFVSADKFDAGCGWPSFSKPSDENNVTYAEDNSLARQRTEVLCDHCGAHLGHVFNDGPTDSGQRYCINSVALSFSEDDGNKGK